MFKIIVMGNSAVGKTSIVNRFVGDKFDPKHKATIAADFQTKHLNLQGNDIRLQIWDLVGMDTSFAAINRSFCRNASGAILVSDITDAKSLEDAASWKEEVD
jgi:small GTP-binding protein